MAGYDPKQKRAHSTAPADGPAPVDDLLGPPPAPVDDPDLAPETIGPEVAQRPTAVATAAAPAAVPSAARPPSRPAAGHRPGPQGRWPWLPRPWPPCCRRGAGGDGADRTNRCL